MNFFEKPEFYYGARGREITGNYSGNIVQQKGITSLKPKQQIGCCFDFSLNSCHYISPARAMVSLISAWLSFSGNQKSFFNCRWSETLNSGFNDPATGNLLCRAMKP